MWQWDFLFIGVDNGLLLLEAGWEVSLLSTQRPIKLEGFGPYSPGCNLDGTLYYKVNTDNIPEGHAAVPVTVDDNGGIYKTRMVAGSVGICNTSSGDILDEGYSYCCNVVCALGLLGALFMDCPTKKGVHKASTYRKIEQYPDPTRRSYCPGRIRPTTYSGSFYQ